MTKSRFYNTIKTNEGEMKIKKKIYLPIVIAIIMAFVVCVVFTGQYFLSKRTEIRVSPNVNCEVIHIDTKEQNYASILSQFESLNFEENDEQKIVNTVHTMYGTNLDDIQYTCTNNAQEVVVCGITTLDKTTNEGDVSLTFNFGEFTEYINATSNIGYDENGNLVGMVTFDGQEYDVQEILNLINNGDIQECWFWLVIKIVIVVVNIIIAAITAYDIYKYLTTEEVTLNGVLCIVAEGLVMSATSFVGGAIAGSLIKAGVKAIKTGKKVSKETSVLLGRNIDTLLDENVKLVKSGKKNNGLWYSDDTNLRKAYMKKAEFKNFNFTDSSKDDYIQIHHFVEQRQVGKPFNAQEIHTDLNSVGIPKVLHEKISALYSSKTKFSKEIEQIFGKGYFKGDTTFRDFVANKSYEEQYEIGMKIFKYFDKQGNYAKLFL